MKMDLIFYPSGEIKNIDNLILNKLIKRDVFIETIKTSKKLIDRNILKIKWDTKINEWTINDNKLKLFLHLRKKYNENPNLLFTV